MTDLMEKVIDELRRVPEQDQDAVASNILLALRAEDQFDLDDNQSKMFTQRVSEGVAAADRGDFANDDEIARVFNKYRPV